jgi:pimeloyl-ACP methyl ester carboxylesterase
MMTAYRVASPQDPTLHLRLQPAPGAIGDVLYVHGATFPSALSVFFRFDGRSWADALNEAGFNAWGFDFAGYGESDRYPAMHEAAGASAPLGRADAAARQLAAALQAVRERCERRPLHLVAHSWGSIPALRIAARHGDALSGLTLFGPLARRHGPAASTATVGWRLLTVWEQYRRFIADVPRGHPPVLDDRHIEAWSRAWLATDADGITRDPPAVKVPAGPLADAAAIFAGEALYDAAAVRVPVLLVRGEWDSVCDDQDARTLQRALAGTSCRDVKIARGTHLMHLEASRTDLHREVNRFLKERHA